MQGYFFSFLVTHLINFLLSIRLLQKLVGKMLSARTVILCAAASVGSGIAARYVSTVLVGCAAFGLLFASLLMLLGIVGKHDMRWVKGLVLR